MPKRPKQHQVEDLSIAEFKKALPREWVYREKSHDYGIDGEVEIFDKDGVATGLMFLVQLKATDSTDNNSQRRVKLSNTSINYYKSLDLQVLIVRYINESQSLLIRWIHKIDRYNTNPDNETFSFKMNDNELWTDETPKYIHQDLVKISKLKSSDNLLPLKIYFDFSFLEICDLSPQKIKSHLREFIEDKSNLCTISPSKDNSDSIIEITTDTMTIHLFTIPSCYFHSFDKTPYKNIEELIGDIFLALSIALIHQNKVYNAIEIYEILANNAPSMELPTIAFEIIKQYVFRNKPEKAYKIWNNIPAKNKGFHSTQIFHMTMAISNIRNKSNVYELFLLDELKKYQDLKEQNNEGVISYNYANYLRQTRNDKKALSYYNKALKFNPHYHNEEYILFEIGGTLFDLQRYSLSAKFYKYGLEKKFDSEMIARYADALMMKGEYLLAKQNFRKYFDNTDDINAEWLLKEVVLDYIIDKVNIKSQHRNYEKAIKIYAVKKMCKRKAHQKELNQIFAIDALFPLAWFNLALEAFNKKNFNVALIGFLICGVHNRTDNEAWINSFKSAIMANIPNLIMPIIYVGYKYNGEEFIQQVYDFAEQIKDKHTVDTIILNLESLVADVNKKKSKANLPLLRMFNGSKFESFNEIIKKGI